MKKLLLLIAPLIFFQSVFAIDVPQNDTVPTSQFEDSAIKNVITVNPREGFKDLFETTPATFTAKLNPQAISFVQDYMDSHGANLSKMKTWGRPYFDMMNSVLAKHHLPIELKYLSVIESALQPYAVSWAGAVGPWQFMPATARDMGLRVNRSIDERTDFTKSTHAASRYLTHLYSLYGDWLLVIAAYNGGPGNVNSAIRKSGSRNFWNLQYYLPAESRNHVKKFIATHYIMEGAGSVTTLTKSEAAGLASVKSSGEILKRNAEALTITGKYNSFIIAQFIKMDIAEFNRLNPGFDKTMSLNGTYDLWLPADKALLFEANKPQILEGSIRLLLTSATL